MQGRREHLIDLRTGQRRVAVPSVPLLSSATAPWRDCLVEEHELDGFAVDEVSCVNHMIVLQLRDTVSVEWRCDGPFRTLDIRPGQVSVVPSGVPHSARFSTRSRWVGVSLTPEFISLAAETGAAGPPPEIVPRMAVDDPLLEHLVGALRTEAAAGAPGGRIYGESLAAALAGHLLRHYNARSTATHQPLELGHPQLGRVLEHLHAHLLDDLPLSALANVAGLSPWHFARLFKRSVGEPPHHYLVRQRLVRAKEMLAGETSLADIAQTLRFCDQSHFAAQFKRAYGVPPQRFRRQLRAKSA